MGSTAAVAQTYNDTNVIGEVLSIGATRNTGRFLAAIGGLNGARQTNAQEFAMSATYSLDAAAQGAISENTSLSAGTADFYAKSQEYNVNQIIKKEIAVSSLREAATQQISCANITVGGMAPTVSEFDQQTAHSMSQFMADWEFACLQGTYVARSAVGTVVATGGLVDSTVGIQTNTVNASSAALSKDLINSLLVTMADAGAPFQKPVFICKSTYVTQISDIYGFQPQSYDVGGVAIKSVITDFGEFGVIWSNAAPANYLIVADLAFCKPTVLPHADGIEVVLREYTDGGSARKGYIEGFVGFDMGAESYHGYISSLA
jgi:hypothetical protein